MRLRNNILARLHNDWHFLLLIIFFITHGYAEHTGMIPLIDLLIVFAVLIVLAMLVFRVSKLMLKDSRKAALFTSFSFAMFLFFGAIQDFIGEFRTIALLAQLKVFFPVSLAAIVIVFIVLRFSSYRFTKLNIFLNALLALYIIVDIGVICFKLLSPAEQSTKELAAYGLNTNRCDTCKRPSVYFILLDEYSGSDALKNYFNYDNSRFEQFLEGEGFKVNRHTSSNYFFTVFSMASTLNMDYISGLGAQSITNHFGYRQASSLVANNVVMRYFQAQGYSINNYSYFQLPGAPVEFKTDYLPAELDLITNKTMYSRVANNLTRFLGRNFAVESVKKKRDEFYIANNEAMMTRAVKDGESVQGSAAPSFTYMHLMLPHDPVAFDSLGNRVTPFWERRNITKKEVDDAYLQYLVYANKRLQSFIKDLKAVTHNNAAIILMSDHGYRKIPGQRDWTYNTLNAVYLPEKNYQQWYDGMTNVNQFRAFFNTVFDQRLPMLKDSLVR